MIGSPKTIDTRKDAARRSKAARNIASALGLTAQQASGAGAGRPRGTYKYGMPIHEYKKQLAQRKALYEDYKRQQNMQLASRGMTPEQVQMAQQAQSSQVQRIRQVSQAPQYPQQVQNVAEEELAFRKFLAQQTVSPNTQKILDNLRRTQLKSQRDDVEMQRRLNERKMVASAGNLLNTPFVFKSHQVDFTGVSGNNILSAPNAFRENPSNFVLRKRGFNILQTREAGNSIGF